MPLTEGVKGGYAHQPVHSLFGLQVAVGVIALYFYPITKEYNERMQAELKERRSKADY